MFPGLEELHFSDNEISTDTAAQILQQVSASRRSRTPLWLRLDRCHQVDAKELIDVYGHIVCTRMCAPYGECQPFHCAHGRKVHCPHLGICGGDPNCPIGCHAIDAHRCGRKHQFLHGLYGRVGVRVGMVS